jgi:hypothetical protein
MNDGAVVSLDVGQQPADARLTRIGWENCMGGRVREIIFDVAIIAGCIVSLALLALAFLFE